MREGLGRRERGPAIADKRRLAPPGLILRSGRPLSGVALFLGRVLPLAGEGPVVGPPPRGCGLTLERVLEQNV